MICKTDGCNLPTVGKSKYCATHRAIAHEKWKELMDAQSEERATRYARFDKLWSEAVQAGMEAAEAKVPVPMVVEQHEANFDDSSPVVKSWFVPGGVCGFAWVRVKPGNSSFARWLVKRDLARKSYKGGVDIWVDGYGQSMEKKEAYAGAFAATLKASPDLAKVKIYAMSRMD